MARPRQIDPGRHELYYVPIAQRSWLSTAGVEADAKPPDWAGGISSQWPGEDE